MSTDITAVTKENGDQPMSAEERKIYDRQIRLWGYKGQNRYVVRKVAVIFYNFINNVFS